MSTLLIQPLNETTEYLYTNHTHYHQGDSGLDLFTPKVTVVPPKTLSFKIGLQIAAEMIAPSTAADAPIACVANRPYWLIPRSSLSKTPLRQCNSVGLIDAGYRGELMAYVDNHSEKPYIIAEGDRLFQICAMDGAPLKMRLAEELSASERGAGGFGSTGK